MTAGRNELTEPDYGRIEASRFAGTLTHTEIVLKGGRFHLFLLGFGNGVLCAENGDHPLATPSLCWLPNGQPRTLKLEAGATGVSLSVPDGLLGRALPQDGLSSQIRQVSGLLQVLHQVEQEPFAQLQHHAGTIERELYENRPGADTILQNTLALILVSLWRLAGTGVTRPLPVPRNIVHAFMSLLDVHLADHWTVDQYARHINVSRDRLTSALRRATGEAPMAIIHAKMMNEAKNILTTSGLQVAEIAFALGFSDPAYFNRFFQRHAGMPPGKFRNETSRLKASKDESFAAWP